MSEQETVVIGDLVIDAESGEVLTLPDEGRADKVAWLTRQLVDAMRMIKAWEAARDGYKRALARAMDEAGVNVLHTPEGTVSRRSRVDRKGDPARIPDVLAAFELSRNQMTAIWECAAALDAARLDALADAGAIPRGAAEALIVERTSSWVQASAPRKLPPATTRTRKDAEA